MTTTVTASPLRTRSIRSAIATVLLLGLVGCTSDTATTAGSSSAEPSVSPTTGASASTRAGAPTSAAAQSTNASAAASSSSAAAPTTAAKPCAQPAAGKAIKLGHINVTGTGLDLPGSGFAVEAYLDKMNACGGFKGQPLELVTRNGGLDPGATGAAARELVEQEGVIGFVGSNAFLDCVVNGDYYSSKGIPVIGSSFDGTCFTNKVVFPSLANFDRNIFPGVVYALEKGAKKFAYIAGDIPGQRAQAEAIDAYLKANGATLETSVFLPPGPVDPTNAILQIQQSGATAVISSIDEVTLSAALNAAIQQDIGPKKLMWIGASGLYTPKAIAALGAAGEGLLIVLNYDVTENGNETAAAVAKDVKSKHPEALVDGFVSIGWISAEVLGAALEKVDGELTSASLLAAMEKVGPIQSKLLPGPITVNGALPRQIPSYGLIAKLEGGAFKLAKPDWIVYPKP
jgi:ABC-type branched-subunit amino acid transport system substrate-binding protein